MLAKLLRRHDVVTDEWPNFLNHSPQIKTKRALVLQGGTIQVEKYLVPRREIIPGAAVHQGTRMHPIHSRGRIKSTQYHQIYLLLWSQRLFPRSGLMKALTEPSDEMNCVSCSVIRNVLSQVDGACLKIPALSGTDQHTPPWHQHTIVIIISPSAGSGVSAANCSGTFQRA